MFGRTLIAAACLLWPVASQAQEVSMRLPLSEPGRWTYVGDTVMGGVSQGAARVESQAGQPVLRLTGEVSTANNGGFIQTRTKLETPPPSGTSGVRIQARGNDQRYFVHLRTTGTSLPWQYYQAAFDVTSDWREFRLPFEAFKPSGNLLRDVPEADSIRSVGIVAFGRDHKADISVRLVGFY